MLPEQTQSTTITIPSVAKAIENGIAPNRQQQSTHENQLPIKLPQHYRRSNNNSRSTTTTTTTSATSRSPSTGDSNNRVKLPRRRWLSFQDNLADNYLERGRRLHGLQLPLHPLQVSGWIALIGFGVSAFSVIIPALHPDLQRTLCSILIVLYVTHGCAHLAAVLIDPADAELRKHSSARIVPEFDRNKHAHVIENGRCHLCNIKTTNYRTKHCSVCNKCVGQFDHHCKWLNHCVGGRNYVAFLMCVVSAVIAALVILAAVVAELVLYYMKSDWLVIWSLTSTGTTNSSDDSLTSQVDSISSAIFNDTFSATNDTTITPDTVSNVTETVFDVVATAGISLHDTIFLAFISVLGILAAITVGLLLHLCFFHVYISFLGLTTYEYIRNQRQNEQQPNQPSKSASAATTPAGSTTLNALKKSSTATQVYFCSAIDPKNLVENHDTKAKYRPKSLHCCDTSMQYANSSHKAFYLCSMLHERPAPVSLPTSLTRALPHRSNQSSNQSRTFHCCSEYKQIVKLAAPSQTNNTIDETYHNESTNTDATSEDFVQFSEQCTFCSFKLKASKNSEIVSIEYQAEDQPEPDDQTQQMHETNRYCDKGISKHHRWKRKWNCCSNVPDSPDVPVDVLRTISASVTDQNDHQNGHQQQQHHRHHHHHCQRKSLDENKSHNKNGAKSLNYSSSKLPSSAFSAKPSIQTIKNNNIRPSLSTNLKKSNRTRLTQPWPLGRLRHILGMFGRCRQPHCQQNGNEKKTSRNMAPPPRVNIKQNQVRPADMPEQQQYEQFRHPCQQQKQIQHMPKQQQHLHVAPQTNVMILPTSIIRSESSENESDDGNSSDSFYSNITMPALPPPVRRKICSPTTEMQELAESLSFVQNPAHHHHHHRTKQQPQQLQQQQKQQRYSNGSASVNSSRRRRKNIFRTRSPTLSPIHESGYSNPTSPQPFRHTTTNESDSNSSTPTPTSSSCVTTSKIDSLSA